MNEIKQPDMPVSASVLGADLMRLGEEIEMAKRVGVQWIHCDHMDGHFVPNISFGPSFLAAIRKKTDLFLDVHLMLEHPMDFIDIYAKAGADLICVHAEAKDDPEKVIKAIKAHGIGAGIAIKPATSPEAIEHLLPLCDMVLVMLVEPGFGGQGLRQDCMDKLPVLRQMIEKLGKPVIVEVDGGVKTGNAGEVLEAGAQMLVMGTGFFGAEDPQSVADAVCREARACGL